MIVYTQDVFYIAFKTGQLICLGIIFNNSVNRAGFKIRIDFFVKKKTV